MLSLISALPFLWPIFLLALFQLLHPTSSIQNLNRFKHQEVVASHGVVASDDGRCSRIGSDVLREGGHAVDAAVAAALCLGVVSPASSGIGGGAFMLIREASTGKTRAFDMREIAPIKASKDMYSGNETLKATGVLSIAVPGELAGLHLAWKLHGRLSWERLVRPAQRLARNGFKISPYLHMQMVKTESGILADKGLRNLLTKSGKLLQPGDICSNKKLAGTLATIAKHGVQAFYNGSIGSQFIKDIQEAGGILTVDDLQRYRVKLREPISANILGLKVIGMPPPSSGGASMILILNILTQYGVPSGISGPLGSHRLIEAVKHAFSVRMNLGDPGFVNVTAVLSDMLSRKFAAKLKKTIYDNMTFDPGHYGGRWNQINDHGTSHLSIVDGERNAVSMTSTINGYFGAQMVSSSTGIFFNNEMDDFSMPVKNSSANASPPAPPNFVSPGKRPLSSMSPTIVLKDDHLKAVVGASGGGMIIAGTTEVFMNYFGKGMDPLSSVLAPRLYHQLIPNKVNFENWTTVYGDHFVVPAKTRAFLEKRGHVLQSLAGGTISQFIVQDLNRLRQNRSGEVLVGVSDPRKGGVSSWFLKPGTPVSVNLIQVNKPNIRPYSCSWRNAAASFLQQNLQK